MGRRWTPEDRKQVHNLYPTMPTGELALLLERSEHSIEHQASLMGILKSTEVLAQIQSLAHQKDYHCEPYLTFRKIYLDDYLSIGAIAEMMGCSISKVQKYLEREGLTRTNLDSKKLLSKLMQHNSTFFDAIDTEEKAYWLGFFYADGYLAKNGSTLKIDLSVKDALHLQRFANIFQTKVLVRERSPDKRNGIVYVSATSVIVCAYLWDAFIEKGVRQGNTLSEDISVFKHVPENLMHHFVRGVFDGDGSVYRHKSGGLGFSFVGSYPFMEYLRGVLIASVELSVTKLGKMGKLTHLRWKGNSASECFKNWLYRDATVWLERKRDVFDA
jgi:hypothetical protein